MLCVCEEGGCCVGVWREGAVWVCGGRVLCGCEEGGCCVGVRKEGAVWV